VPPGHPQIHSSLTAAATAARFSPTSAMSTSAGKVAGRLSSQCPRRRPCSGWTSPSSAGWPPGQPVDDGALGRPLPGYERGQHGDVDADPGPVALAVITREGLVARGVPRQGGHEGGRDRLPPDGLAFLAQQDQALVRVEVLRAQRQRSREGAAVVALSDASASRFCWGRWLISGCRERVACRCCRRRGWRPSWQVV